MSDYACRYVVAKFVRNPIREEAKNIGIILQCSNLRYVGGRFEEELERISPSPSDRIVIGQYSQWVSDLLNQTTSGNSLFTERELSPEFLNKLSQFGIGSIQFTEPRGCVTSDPDQTLDELYEMLVVSDELADEATSRESRKKAQNIMICENCKWWERLSPREGLCWLVSYGLPAEMRTHESRDTQQPKVWAKHDQVRTSPDFGCNQWEKGK
jgi:hypothetical protein